MIVCYMKTQRENDKDHKVRLAIGNGIRAEIWKEFLSRFGNIEVREFYASTEGNVGFVNYAGKIGAIGRVNLLHQVRMKVSKYICIFVFSSLTSTAVFSILKRTT